MSDFDAFESVKKRIYAFIDERNWRQFHSPKNLAISISLEASELLEHFQWKDQRPNEIGEKREEISDEVADIFVYLVEFADLMGIDILKAAEQKLSKNAIKYPVEKSRDSCKKYTEI